MAFSVLLVCTANLCRSPIAAAQLDAAVTELGLDWDVRSAGTAAVSGRRIHELTRTVLDEAGTAPVDEHAHALTDELVQRSHLVLTATVAHRQQVIAHDVRALRRTFTLRQFARWCQGVSLISTDPSLIGPDLVTGALQARSRMQPGLAGADDIADPIGGTIDTFRSCRDVIADAVESVVAPVRSSPALTGKD